MSILPAESNNTPSMLVYAELAEFTDIVCRFLQKENADSLIPVVKYSYPIQRSFRIENDRLVYVYPENVNKRSQDLESIYHDAGQFYWAKSNVILNSRSIVNLNTIPFILPESEVQDIDSEDDWKLAELKYVNLPNN